MDLVLADYRVRPRSIIEEELYAASPQKLTERLRRLDEEDFNVLLIGHNPGIHELAVTLADANSPDVRALVSGKFPTAARASFEIPGPWSALGGSHYELLAYVTVEPLRGGKG
jgi:phosphohistidine phosphatase